MTNNLPVGVQSGLSTITVSALATLVLASGTLTALWLLFRCLPRANCNAATMALDLVLAGGTVRSIRLVDAASSFSSTVEQASHGFDALLGPEDRVIDGQPSIVESRRCNLVMIDRRAVGHPGQGMACLDEFQPTHRLIGSFEPLDRGEFDRRLRHEFADGYLGAPGTWKSESCPDERVKMRIHSTPGRMAPDPREISARR